MNIARNPSDSGFSTSVWMPASSWILSFYSINLAFLRKLRTL